MSRLTIVSILIFTLFSPTSGFALDPGLRDQVAAAVTMKKQGRLNEAVALYEQLIDQDRMTLAYPGGGLLDDLIQQYEQKVVEGDSEVLFRLAHLTDLNGHPGKAEVWYREVAADATGELAEKARFRAEGLRREQETYDQYLQDHLRQIRRVADEERERLRAQRERDQAEAEIHLQKIQQTTIIQQTEDELATMEKAVETQRQMVQSLHGEMLDSKRDWEGRGNVRTWRLRPGDKPGDYNNTFRRRYRQDKKRYESAIQKLKEMERQLEEKRSLIAERGYSN